MKENLGAHQEAIIHATVMEKLWTKPLVDLFKDRLPRPVNASVLVAEARCGHVPVRWSEMLSENTRVIALDGSRTMLDHARQRTPAHLSGRIFFVPQSVESMSYADAVFRAAACFNGLSTAPQFQAGLSELARVVEPGGQILLVLPVARSFPQIHDLLCEALETYELHDALERLKAAKGQLVEEPLVVSVARNLGLHDLQLERCEWEVAFESGQAVMMSPLLRETFFPHWMGMIRSTEREHIMRYVVDAIDTYFHGRSFTLNLHALCLICSR